MPVVAERHAFAGLGIECIPSHRVESYIIDRDGVATEQNGSCRIAIQTTGGVINAMESEGIFLTQIEAQVDTRDRFAGKAQFNR